MLTSLSAYEKVKGIVRLVKLIYLTANTHRSDNELTLYDMRLVVSERFARNRGRKNELECRKMTCCKLIDATTGPSNESLKEVKSTHVYCKSMRSQLDSSSTIYLTDSFSTDLFQIWQGLGQLAKVALLH